MGGSEEEEEEAGGGEVGKVRGGGASLCVFTELLLCPLPSSTYTALTLTSSSHCTLDSAFVATSLPHLSPPPPLPFPPHTLIVVMF